MKQYITKYQPIVLNLLGGPGISKSTLAAALFAECKFNNIGAELVTEVAKTMTWEKTPLSDQIAIFGKQQHAMEILRGQVDVIITDSPLLLSHYYNDTPYKYFGKLIDEVYNSYQNINVVLDRVKPYHPRGRSQTKEQAMEIDKAIWALASSKPETVNIFRGERESIEGIFKLITDRLAECETVDETEKREEHERIFGGSFKASKI